MKTATTLFLVTLALYTLTAGGHLYSPDEEVLFRVTRSLVKDRDLAIEPLGGFATSKAKDGKEYAQYGIGQPILAIPFYWVGSFVAPLLSDATWTRISGIVPNIPVEAGGFPNTGTEIAPRMACAFFNILISAILAGVLYLILFELTLHRTAAIMTTLLYAFGSLAWAHSRPFFSEVAAVLFILLAWLFALKGVTGSMTLRMALAGAAAGFAALVRMDSVLLYPGLALVLLGPVLRASRVQRPRIHPFVAFCLPALACGGVLLGLNWLHFGSPLATGYTDQPEGVAFSTPLAAGLYGFLFSAGKGLFFFSPALVLGFFGWGHLMRRDIPTGLGVVFSVLIPLILMSKWQNWAGGWCWGPRHIFMIHPFLAFPIATWLAHSWDPLRRGLSIGMLLTGAFVQLLGCSQDFMAFHWTYFRNHGLQNYRVLYDDFDARYWAQYYKLHAQTPPPGRYHDTLTPPAAPSPWVEPGFVGSLPAPIQHSIYIPQNTVWSGYPKMWRDYRTLDNIWYRIIRGDPPPPPVK